MKKLTTAVVGIGLGKFHVEAYQAADDVGRIVLCDIDRDRLQVEKAAHSKIDAVYTDIDEMLATEDIDGVSVATPDQFHLAHATSVIESGTDLLLTKPIACNLADAEVIVSRANGKGVRLMIAQEARYRSRSVRLKQLIDEGYFGEIIHIRMDAIHDKRKQFNESPWYASAEAGRTATIGTGVHEIDFLRFLVGRKVVGVKAFGNSLGPLTFPRDKTVAALFKFEGGAIGQTTVTYEARWNHAGMIDDGFRLIGSKGMAVGYKITNDDERGWVDLPKDKNEVRTGTVGIVNAFVRSLAHDAAISVSGEDGLVSLRLCDTVDRATANDELAPA